MLNFSRRALGITDVKSIFLTKSYPNIKTGKIVPNINLIFDDDYLPVLESAVGTVCPVKVNDKYKKTTYDDIKFYTTSTKSEDGVIDIHIKDTSLFFSQIYHLAQSLSRVWSFYDKPLPDFNAAHWVMTHIWLRMGPYDIENVHEFLKKQQEFINDNRLDTYREYSRQQTFMGYKCRYKTELNNLWYETNKRVVFMLEDGINKHQLPSIHYGIDRDNVCYIYAIQTFTGPKDKKIGRSLYKLNEGIDNPNIHPNKMAALLLFIRLIKYKGIKKVVVPSLQVLSYPLHEIFGENAKERLPECKEGTVEYNQLKARYEEDYGKQDKISSLKIEDLLNAVYRLPLQDDDITILNEVGFQGDSVLIKVEEKKRRV